MQHGQRFVSKVHTGLLLAMPFPSWLQLSFWKGLLPTAGESNLQIPSGTRLSSPATYWSYRMALLRKQLLLLALQYLVRTVVGMRDSREFYLPSPRRVVGNTGKIGFELAPKMRSKFECTQNGIRVGIEDCATKRLRLRICRIVNRWNSLLEHLWSPLCWRLVSSTIDVLSKLLYLLPHCLSSKYHRLSMPLNFALSKILEYLRK